MLLRLLSLALLIDSTISSYCGQSAIPFTFQVLRSGHPVLGCARPRCLGWNSGGDRAGDTAQFYRIEGKEDGYLRRSDQTQRAPNANPNFRAQTSLCDEQYRSTNCNAGEWVGGLAPQTDPLIPQLQIRCCRYAPLLATEDKGIALVQQGQLVVGGEVTQDSKLVAFDYISDIRKTVSENGNVSYSVSVRRMSCLDESGESEVSSVAAIQTEADTNKIEIPTTTQQSATLPTVDQIQAYYAQQRNSAAAQQPSAQQPYGHSSQQGYGLGQQQNQAIEQYGVGYPQLQVQQSLFPTQQQIGQQQGAQNQFVNPMFGNPFQVMTPPPNVNIASPQINPLPQPRAQGVPLQPVGAQLPLAPMPTLAPIVLPRLEDIPKMDIPTVEDVENVIPPVQRAILTQVAKFFGVLT